MICKSSYYGNKQLLKESLNSGDLQFNQHERYTTLEIKVLAWARKINGVGLNLLIFHFV
jgi:hypothetical protein